MRSKLKSAFAVGLLAVASTAFAQMGTTLRVSVSSNNDQGNEGSAATAISADGRYVAFYSGANNLVQGDTNGTIDVFVRDRQTRQTTRVSVSSSGEQGNDISVYPAISADGRYVAFQSLATNLVQGDTNGYGDVFVHDRSTGQTTRVSVSSSGEQTDDYSRLPAISANGRFVAFNSDATTLVPGDTNNAPDVFVHDRQTGQTTRVSVTSSGQQSAQGGGSPTISGEGRYVAFQSYASDLVQGDTNGLADIFAHDRQTGQTTRISVSSSGLQANGSSYLPFASADERHVVFESNASNLVFGDTNNSTDIFLYELGTGQTERVSLASGGGQSNSVSVYPSISANGRYVAFISHATNLVQSDTNGYDDAFVYDRQSGLTRMVSVSSSGIQGNANVFEASISGNGRYVAFSTSASNLVGGDTGGYFDVFVHQYLPGKPWWPVPISRR